MEAGVWLHVDGAYGGAALAAASVRSRFAGIELADSFIVDPHKWFFAPYDCCALLYRDPRTARAAHSQHASYLDQIDREAWNPSDYATQLTRRARGLPFWFSLAVHGTDKYRAAVEHTLSIARDVAAGIEAMPHLELVKHPELSVLLFRRRGWNTADYQAWSQAAALDGRSCAFRPRGGARQSCGWRSPIPTPNRGACSTCWTPCAEAHRCGHGGVRRRRSSPCPPQNPQSPQRVPAAHALPGSPCRTRYGQGCLFCRVHVPPRRLPASSPSASSSRGSWVKPRQ